MSGSAAAILVTGATGQHGSTGAHVARRLREEGKPVRILARALSDRTDALAALGVDVVIANVGAAVAARGALPADCSELARLIDRTPMSIRDFVRANRANLEVTR